MAIPDDCKTQVISSSIDFIRVITEVYGADEGMKLWEKIADVLDPDLKGEVFFSMLTNEHYDRLILRASRNVSNRVAPIKSVREHTGLGLKEAKDIIDAVTGYAGMPPRDMTIILNNPRNRHRAISDLRQCGITV